MLTCCEKTRIFFLAENAPLPQLDRGTDYESVRRGFESLTAHHLNCGPEGISPLVFFFSRDVKIPDGAILMLRSSSFELPGSP